ncbi:hypothetical protein [Actinokineospora diospyrosa]|uniref:Uncharacterized protein n=1 Tax=Actinokineospora diospyrosa TaxID=103728 RepID=A0ABT1IDI2_9PSEU|nr:hypothetical protein [Actinokineospora diospyrosa]MCP2270685.1 hypothetical protein [Actinokineospora diospyrosa]
MIGRNAELAALLGAARDMPSVVFVEGAREGQDQVTESAAARARGWSG